MHINQCSMHVDCPRMRYVTKRWKIHKINTTPLFVVALWNMNIVLINTVCHLYVQSSMWTHVDEKMSFHICNGLCHWFSAMVVTEPVTCPTCPTQSTFTWLDYLTYIQLNRHPIENLHLILSLFPRPLQSLTHPSLPWCWRQNKASLCLISFSSMPVPRRSLLRPALSELFMEFPPVLLDGKREVLCWSWSGPLGLQYAGMIFPWQPTKQTPVGR